MHVQVDPDFWHLHCKSARAKILEFKIELFVSLSSVATLRTETLCYKPLKLGRQGLAHRLQR